VSGRCAYGFRTKLHFSDVLLMCGRSGFAGSGESGFAGSKLVAVDQASLVGGCYMKCMEEYWKSEIPDAGDCDRGEGDSGDGDGGDGDGGGGDGDGDGDGGDGDGGGGDDD